MPLPSDTSSRSDDGEKPKYKCLYIFVTAFLPYSKVRVAWDVFMFISLWYYTIIIPVNFFILKGAPNPAWLEIVYTVLDTAFLLDFIHHFFRPYIDQYTGATITNVPEIVMRYRRSFLFYVNFISCIPLLEDMLFQLLDSENQYAFMNTFNAIRMVRILLFPYFFRELKIVLTHHYQVNESVFRMGIILLFHTSLMYILGCVYFGIGTSSLGDVCPPSEAYGAEIRGEESWIVKDSVIASVMDPSICHEDSHRYGRCNSCPRELFFTRAVYFLMQTLFTIGYGDSVVPSRSVVELVSACIFLIFGVFGYGLVIASMTSVLGNLDAVGTKFRHDREMINRWLAVRSAPDPLRKQVDLTMAYLTRTQYGMLDECILNELPSQIVSDLGRRNLWLIERVPFFNPQYRSEFFLLQISAALVRRIYPPRAIMVYEGEKQRELIMLKSGKADVFMGDGSEPASVLFPGEYIGDYQLLFDTIHHFTIRSQDFVEALVLSFSELKRVLDYTMNSETKLTGDFTSYRHINDDQGALDTIDQSRRFLELITSSASKSAGNKNRSHKLQKIGFDAVVVSQGFRIPPSSRIHVYWGIFSLLAILYYTISLPIRVAYFSSLGALRQSFNRLFAIDYLLDFMFLIDIYLRMRVYSYESIENGRSTVITDINLMTRRYLSSRSFRINCLCLVPFDLLTFIFGYASLLRSSKLIRIFQLQHVVSTLQRDLELCVGVVISSSQLSSLMMIISSILIIVWCSCGWNMIRGGEVAYKSVYWTVTTITTVGYGDIIPLNVKETVYAIVVGAIGATFTAAIIANITNFFHEVDVTDESLNHKFTILKCFYERHSCEPSAIKKLKEYFDYKERENDGVDESSLISHAIPPSLKNNFLIQITRSMVLNCELFSGCEAGFLRRVMLSLEQRFYAIDTFIINGLLPLNGMFFIRKGAIELSKPGEDYVKKETTVLGVDDNFGMECLLKHRQSITYIAKSLTDCEVWLLGRTTFCRLLKEFPRVHQQLCRPSIVCCSSRRNEEARIADGGDKDVTKASTFSLHPESYFVQFWFGLVFIGSMYYVVVIPFRIAFLENHDLSRKWLFLDYSCDVLLLADLIIRSCFLAVYKDNVLLVKRGEIMKHFLRSHRFKWYLLSSLPLELAIFRVSMLCPYFWRLQTWSFFRLNRTLRIIEVGKLLHFVEESFIKAGFRFSRNAVRAAKLLMMILLTAHIIGCLFFLIAAINQKYYFHQPGLQRNWAKDQGLFVYTASTCPGNPVSWTVVLRQYVASIYYVIATLTTVGYGDITANKDSAVEIIFATVFLIAGTAFCSMVIGLLEDVFSQLDVTTTLYQKKIRRVEEYMTDCALPEYIRTRIMTYYDALWKLHKGENGNKVILALPPSFRGDMMMDMLSPILTTTFFISNCAKEVVLDLLDVLHLEIYIADDVLFSDGQLADNLFFLHSGDFDLCTTGGVKFKTVSQCAIDESSFFLRECYSYTARSVHISEVFILTIDNFNRTLFENNMSKAFIEMLTRNQQDLRAAKESLLKMVYNFKSTKMAKMIVTEGDDAVPRGLVLPGNAWRQMWDFTAMTFIFWIGLAIPYYASYYSHKLSRERMIVDIFVDVFFLLDSYARAKKFAFVKNGSIVLDPKEITRSYMKEDFRHDLVSLMPASWLGYIAGAPPSTYSWLRLFQFIRVARFWKCFQRVISIIESRRKQTLAAAATRLVFVFILMVFICHLYAAIYHIIGKQGIASGRSWIIADHSLKENAGMLYLRSFYWALYTLTTTGYGNIPVLTNKERLFAIFAMITGAAACDAGIAALLSSMISDIDEQTSENSRRLKCSKKYMSSIGVEKDLYDRVLSYYSYVNDDLNNISETRVINDFSPSLRTEIFKHFCFQSLRLLALFSDISDGALLSIAESMKPYVATPGEILSEIGYHSHCLYVLQRGMVRCKDSAGTESFLPLGSVIGHYVTRAEFDTSSVGSKTLRIELISAYGLTSRHQSPYLIFKMGSCSCRSSIMKTHDWKEACILKLPTAHEKKLNLEVKSWQKGPNHPAIGVAHIHLTDELIGIKQDIVVYDMQGKRTGLSLRMCFTYVDILPCDNCVGHENTVLSIGFSHLYKLEWRKVEEVKKFVAAAINQTIVNRLDERYFSIGKTDTKTSAVEAGGDEPTNLTSENCINPSPAPVAPLDINVEDHTNAKGIRTLFDRAKRFSQTFPVHDDTENPNSHLKASGDFIMSDSNATIFSQGMTFESYDSAEKVQEEDSWDNLLVSSSIPSNTGELKLSDRFFIEWG